MIIHIGVEEFEEEYRKAWISEYITKPHIDYATNALHGCFEGNEIIFFRFKNYGFINDNRFCSYKISSGSAGVTIIIEK